MKIIAGTAVGQLKYVAASFGAGVFKPLPSVLGAKAVTSASAAAAQAATSSCKTFFAVDREKQVDFLCLVSCESDNALLLVARATGNVDLVKMPINHTSVEPCLVASHFVVNTIAPASVNGNFSRFKVVGMDMVSSSVAVIALSNGQIVAFDVNTGEIMAKAILDFKKLQANKSQNGVDQIAVLRVCRHYRSMVAVGGRNINLGLFDLNGESGKNAGDWKQYNLCVDLVWGARNEANDYLDLARPVDVSDIVFIRDSLESIAVSTCFGEIKVYSPFAATNKKNARAKLVFRLRASMTEPLKCLADASSKDTTVLLTGGAKGSVLKVLVDRKQTRLLHKYKGATGSVAMVQPASPMNELSPVVAVGLDRSIRLWDAKETLPVSQWYTKQQISCLLLLKESSNDAFGESRVNLPNQSKDDILWNELNEAAENDKSKIKSRKRKR